MTLCLNYSVPGLVSKKGPGAKWDLQELRRKVTVQVEHCDDSLRLWEKGELMRRRQAAIRQRSLPHIGSQEMAVKNFGFLAYRKSASTAGPMLERKTAQSRRLRK